MQLGTNVLIYYILIFFILFLFLVLTRRLANKTEDTSYFVMLKSQKTFNLSLSFYASGMGLWIIASPAEVGWYGLGFDVIGYAISAATPFVLLYFVGPRIVQTVPDKATLPQYISQQYGNFAQVFVSIIATIHYFLRQSSTIVFNAAELESTASLGPVILMKIAPSLPCTIAANIAKPGLGVLGPKGVPLRKVP